MAVPSSRYIMSLSAVHMRWFHTTKNLGRRIRPISGAIGNHSSSLIQSVRTNHDITCGKAIRLTSQRLFSGERDSPPDTQTLDVQVKSSKKHKTVRVCYGCGADIVPKNQFSDDDGIMSVKERKTGYWEDRKNTLRKSKISNWSLCERCRALKQGNADHYAPIGAAMEAFRKQVIQIKSHHAVVVAVVDAANIAGTVIPKIRDYVGGNPILLAVTRCDLLPSSYLSMDESAVKRAFAERAKGLNVAQVFLISLPPGDDNDEMDFEDKNHGTNPEVSQLAAALLKNRCGRDVYIVGAANIGKSTLTDALVDELIEQQGLGNFLGHRLGKKRVDAIRERRVTRSALPGTTLQNIRVPCFLDHQEALWDTPGLLLDASKAHFPIRKFQEMLRSPPRPIVPIELVADKAAFVVQISEAGDDERLPLLRIVVRLKRGEKRNASATTRLVWNCVFGLDAKVFDKPPDPPVLQTGNDHKNEEKNESEGLVAKKASWEERRKAYEARTKAEQEELGMAEWQRRDEERRKDQAERKRTQKLQELHKVATLKIDFSSKGTDLAIENLGWFSFLSERDALVEVHAPSRGVKVSATPALSLPEEWGVRRGQDGHDSDEEDEYNIDEDDEFKDDGEVDDWWGDDVVYGYDDHAFGGGGFDYGYDDQAFDDSEYDRTDNYKMQTKTDSSGKEFPHDPWGDYAGANVGWVYLEDTRYSKANLAEGWNHMSQEEEADSKQEWKPPLEEHYDISDPEPWRNRRGGGNQQRERPTRRGDRFRGKGKNINSTSSKKQKRKKGGNFEW